MTAQMIRDNDDPLLGTVIAERYRMEEVLGEGAMGSVYRAQHIRLPRTFAIKVLHARLTRDAKMALRFEREAELAARVRHPNLIGVVDVGTTEDDQHYIVLDFAAGRPLHALLAEGPMESERIISLVRQLLDGLQHAHDAGLIHRDFKPENVIVDVDDLGREIPRIVDFGIAILREREDNTSPSGERLTTDGLVLGTPQYMAPEQAAGDALDHRADLFALGVIVYQMVSGKLPFDGTGAAAARANMVLDPPPIEERSPGLVYDPKLDAFARRLMAKNRNDRPSSARAARELLDGGSARIAVAGEVSGARPAEPATPVNPGSAAGRTPSGRDITPIAVDLAFSETMAQPELAPTKRRGRVVVLACLLVALTAAMVFWLVHRRTHDTAPGSLPASDPPVFADASVDEPSLEVRKLPPVVPQVPHTPPHANSVDDAAVTAVPDVDVDVAPSDAGSHVAPPPVVHPTPDAPPKLPPITPNNFRARYEAVQRMLKTRGTQEMWARFLGISANAMAFPDKQKEAIERLTQLERDLVR